MKPRKKSLRAQIAEQFARRQDALKNGFKGLVPVLCGTCSRPIATSWVDRAKGEPPILMEFPEDAAGWTCTRCAA